TALAVAVVASAAAFFHAAPTQALESPTAPVASTLVFHASASVDGSDLSLNPVAPETVQPTDEPVSVVEHAVQTTTDSSSSDEPRPLDQLVGDYAASSTEDSEHECLASAVYF